MCGIIGIIGSSNIPTRSSHWAAYETYRGLLTLQHRGQDAAGILAYDLTQRKFSQEKSLGLVNDVFSAQNVSRLHGNLAIGHTRYATAGSDSKDDLQPLVTGFPFGFGLVHNGNIVNYHPLVESLKTNYQLQLLTQNDLEVLMHLWGQSFLQSREDLTQKPTFQNIVSAAEFIYKNVKGGFAVAGALAGMGLLGMRDAHGIRPLVLGQRKHPGHPNELDYCLASESKTLAFLGFEFVRDIAPGEVILITPDGQVHSQVVINNTKPKHCMFEWVYFAGAESFAGNQTIYQTRLNLGKQLAIKVKAAMDAQEINPDYVCPVPDTSRTASISMAEVLHLPYREGLIKNRYVQRSFILNNQAARNQAVELKLTPVESEIKGKNILLVDDSVVRGTTSKRIINLLKHHGAKEITLAITCPPLRYACFYGIDFPDHEELIANGKTEQMIADYMGAKQVIYLDEQDLEQAIGTKALCMGCINGKYPTDITGADEFRLKRKAYKAGSSA